MTAAVSRGQRHLGANRCPICGGNDGDPRGQGKRCSGFTSEGGEYVHCSRSELGGAIEANGAQLYAHRMVGLCRCGQSHGGTAAPARERDTVYSYADERGIELFQVVRKPGKKFLQRVPDGAGGWLWKLGDTRRVPYRLPGLIAADPGKPVFIPEGEKDADNLSSRGLVSTCNPGGAGKWSFVADTARVVLRDRDVVVVADRDEPGERHALDVARRLEGAARSVRIVVPPAPHKDVTDLLEAGGSVDDLVPFVAGVNASKTTAANDHGATAARSASQADWRAKLITSTRTVGRGEEKETVEVVQANLANVVTILSEHPAWRGVLAYDLFAERAVTTRPPPWHADDAAAASRAGELTETDTARILLWLYRTERLNVTDKIVAQAIGVVTEKNLVHPVLDYVRGLKWDGIERLPEAAATYFGAESSEYSRAVVKRWFISAIARVEEPGAQCDCVLILEGRTGWRKSSAFRALVPQRELYADSGIAIGSKDSYQNIHGVWIYGFDELDSLGKAELTATKNFITQTFDRFRPPFGKAPRNFYRQNVFAGTTNKDDYLNDPTGDRRYWPLRVTRPIDADIIARDRDQLWAEAYARYKAGEPWHVDTPTLRKLCEDEQCKRTADDAWAPLLSDWLKNPTVRAEDGLPERIDVAAGVSTTEVLLGALSMRPSDITRAHETRAGVVLRQLGLTHVTREATGARARRYRRPTNEERQLTEDGRTLASTEAHS